MQFRFAKSFGSVAVLMSMLLLAWLGNAGVRSAKAQESVTPADSSKEDPEDPLSLAQQIEVATKRKSDIDARVEFDVTYTPQQVRRGQVVKVIVRGRPKPGFHTYPATKLAANMEQADASATKLETNLPTGVKALWPLEEKGDAEFEEQKGLGWFLQYNGPFSLSQDILVLPDAKPGPLTLPIKLGLTVCDAKTCLPGSAEFDALINVSNESPLPLSPALQDRLKLEKPQIQRVPAPVARDAAGSVEVTRPPAQAGDAGILAFALLGIGWGAISLLTPCVFPMIPITVSFFLKQSEKQHHKPLTMALVYSGTIVIVLAAGGLILGKGLQQAIQHWATNFLLGAIFIVFALSLFGMFELTVPSWLVNLTSAREGQGGLVGTMFMALTFTLISFACVAPFYGAFIGLTASAQSATDWLRLALGAISFSATFASPFFLLALFPSLLRRLPKSGSWMNTVKVIMGFLELAAAIKFLRAFELLYFAQAKLLTYDLVLGMYVVIALLCGFYLLNLYRLPHDDAPAEHVGVPRLLFGMAFLTLAFYIMPGLFKTNTGQQQRPSGPVFAWVDSFLLPDTDADPDWSGDLDKAVKRAQEEKKLVFVDFTGLTCTNCKLNEKDVFSKRDVKQLFNKYVLVQLFTDAVPPHYQGIRTAEQNKTLQHDLFKGDIQLPLYAIMRPVGDGKFEVVARYSEGLINDVEGFKDFLRKPQAVVNMVARAGDNS
jgi:thiol:disulfide interchange protein